MCSGVMKEFALRHISNTTHAEASNGWTIAWGTANCTAFLPFAFSFCLGAWNLPWGRGYVTLAGGNHLYLRYSKS